MMTTNTIILFQMFIDPDPIEHKYIEDTSLRREMKSYSKLVVSCSILE